MNNQTRFKALLVKYCSSREIVTTVHAAMGKKRIQVSVGAIGGRRSKRLAKFAKEMKRLEKDLRRTFHGRKVQIEIWANGKKPSVQKISKPFQGKNITIITAPINF